MSAARNLAQKLSSIAGKHGPAAKLFQAETRPVVINGLRGAVAAAISWRLAAQRVCAMQSVDDARKAATTEKLSAVHEAETKILARMHGTPYEVMDVAVPVEYSASSSSSSAPAEYTIRTVVVGREHTDKVPIVLIHGYMMGAPAFFKLLPLLAKERTVYAVDIIGMGGSGRPPFDSKVSADHAEKMLVAPFERWADQMGLSQFALIGHSFGGFVASSWANRQPERIRSLGLLSPLLGWSEEKISNVEQRMENSWFGTAVDVAWRYHITPHSLVRRVPGFKRWLSSSNERRFASMSKLGEEEGRLMSEYVLHSMDMPASMEKTVTVCFGKWLRAADTSEGTIKERLSKLSMPIFAVNGDRDWMEAATSDELPNIKFEVLPGSGHHLYFDNPSGLAEIVFQHLKGL
eukprot:TRINITY_DN101492_c0_g1_i1.p1 TRINITY_DN101492_c0_g1~~TRINITY_DN101492_c0_g1_i1.p1  ORF type:complete len:436 (-),score=56.40 TRINITY_DN101492_c0_g1_i1:327-1541(-)